MNSTYLFREFCHYFPPLIPVINNFKCYLIKAHDKKIHEKFLKNCMKEHVLPVSLLPRRLASMGNKPFGELQRVVLKYYIEETIREKQELFKLCNYHRSVFDVSIPQHWSLCMLQYIYSELTYHCRQLKIKLDRKLKRLINQSDWTKAANNECVINLSSRVLTEDEKNSFGFGYNFAASNFKVNPTEIAKGFLNLEKYSNCDGTILNLCKGFVYNSLNNCNYDSCPRRFSIAYNSIRKQRDLHVTKADKSSALVIMDKRDYVNKMEELLSDNQTYVQLDRNPLSTVNSSYNRVIERIFSFSKELKYKLNLLLLDYHICTALLRRIKITLCAP